MPKYSYEFDLTFPIDFAQPAFSHNKFTYHFDYDYGICFGTCGQHLNSSISTYDLSIHYSGMDANTYIDCLCSRWDVDNYTVIIEFWMKNPDLQILVDSTRPGAVRELYNILGKPFYYDESWTGANTIKLKPRPGSRLAKMRDTKIVFPKTVTTVPIQGASGWHGVKIEAYLSGNQDL